MKFLSSQIIILLFACSVAAGQSLPSKKEQYDFLKWYVIFKKMQNVQLSDTISWLATNTSEIKSFIQILREPKVLSKTDLDYLKKQLVANRPRAILDKNELQGIIWRSNFNPDSRHNYISLPIFSSNKKLAFIQHRYRCGSKCGEDQFEIYYKDSKKGWKESKLAFIVPISVF